MSESMTGIIGNGYKGIALSKGAHTIVDEKDYEWLSQWKWHLSAKGYACRRLPKKPTIFMHRLINNTPEGLQTDHINHDKLDNRRSNLRTVTNQQNQFNKPLQKNSTSGHAGISWDKSRSKWMAYITVNDKRLQLGRYIAIDHAIEARKNAKGMYHV